jgi:hypothetical protein
MTVSRVTGRLMTVDHESVRLSARCVEARSGMDEELKSSEAVRTRWSGIWSACGIVLESSSAMLAWVRRRAGVVEQAVWLRDLRLEREARADSKWGVTAQLAETLKLHGRVTQRGVVDLLPSRKSC